MRKKASQVAYLLSHMIYYQVMLILMPQCVTVIICYAYVLYIEFTCCSVEQQSNFGLGPLAKSHKINLGGKFVFIVLTFLLTYLWNLRLFDLFGSQTVIQMTPSETFSIYCLNLFDCKHTRIFFNFFCWVDIQLRTRTTKRNKVTLYNVLYFICIDIWNTIGCPDRTLLHVKRRETTGLYTRQINEDE